MKVQAAITPPQMQTGPCAISQPAAAVAHSSVALMPGTHPRPAVQHCTAVLAPMPQVCQPGTCHAGQVPAWHLLLMPAALTMWAALQGTLMVTDEELLQGMLRCKELGVLPMVRSASRCCAVLCLAGRPGLMCNPDTAGLWLHA